MSVASGSDDRQQQKAQIVLPVRQRRRDEGELRLRHPDVPGSAASSSPTTSSIARPCGASCGRSSATTRRRSAGWPAPGPADPAPGPGGQGQGAVGDVLDVCEEAFVYNPWDVGTTRDAAEAAEQLGYHRAGPVAARVGPGPGQRRRLLPQPGPHLRAERELAEGDPVLGAGQEARPDRREGEPADQRPLGQRHDRAVGAQRGDRASAWRSRHDARDVRPDVEDDSKPQAADPRGAPARRRSRSSPTGSALPPTGRHLPVAEQARRGREDPGPRPEGDPRRQRPADGLRRGPDRPPPARDREADQALPGAAGRRGGQGQARRSSRTSSTTTRSRSSAAGSRLDPTT